jgi:hypothetical protein
MLNKYMFSQKHHDNLSTQKEMTMQTFTQMFKSYNNICDLFYRMENFANIYNISLFKSFSFSKPKKKLSPSLLIIVHHIRLWWSIDTILFTLVGANNGDEILTACLESLTNLVKLKSVTFIKIIGVLL